MRKYDVYSFDNRRYIGVFRCLKYGSSVFCFWVKVEDAVNSLSNIDKGETWMDKDEGIIFDLPKEYLEST